MGRDFANREVLFVFVVVLFGVQTVGRLNEKQHEMADVEVDPVGSFKVM